MLRTIGKQSGESVEPDLKKNRNATVGRICKNEGIKPGMKECGGDGILVNTHTHTFNGLFPGLRR